MGMSGTPRGLDRPDQRADQRADETTHTTADDFTLIFASNPGKHSQLRDLERNLQGGACVYENTL